MSPALLRRNEIFVTVCYLSFEFTSADSDTCADYLDLCGRGRAARCCKRRSIDIPSTYHTSGCKSAALLWVHTSGNILTSSLMTIKSIPNLFMVLKTRFLMTMFRTIPSNAHFNHHLLRLHGTNSPTRSRDSWVRVNTKASSNTSWAAREND